MNKRLPLYVFLIAAMGWMVSCNRTQDVRQEKEVYVAPEKPVSPIERQVSKSAVNSLVNKDVPRAGEFHYTATKYDRIGDLIHNDLNMLATREGHVIQNILTSPTTPGSSLTDTFEPTQWIFRIDFDNDIFANTDYYYTNGTGFQLITPFLNNSPMTYILPGLKNATIDLNGFFIRQNMYTPVNPDVTEIQYGDHPFGATLTLGQFREVYDLEKKLVFKSKITFGVLGKGALGAEIQSALHNIHPVGWVNQINSDFILNYSFTVSKAVVSSPLFELNLSGAADIGTLYDNIRGGTDIRIGRFIPVYRGPISVFGLNTPGNKWQYWFSIKTGIKAVAYDATLQGGMLNKDNRYVIADQDINRLVYYGNRRLLPEFRIDLRSNFYYPRIQKCT
ncbi:MAG: lipid A deacylase LpxR family protein [Chlorobi bacterium]|nr:lipid A deacylase LpxR family protein [Chlorobiota bacterium]